MREICHTYNASFFLDSSKDLKRLQFLRCCEDLDIYVVHLVRDGRGQTLSRMKRGHNNMETSATLLARYDKQAHNFSKHLNGNRYCLIKYEDVCAAPQDTLDTLTSFLHLQQETLTFDNNHHEQHILGNPMLKTFTGKITLNEKWKRELSPESLDRFNKIAGNRNHKYGYR